MPESVKRHLGVATEQLSAVSTSPRLDAELLLAHSLDWPRSRLFARPEEQLSAAASQRFLELLQAREQGLPIAYILGEQEFFSLRFEVGDGVLVPRPETERLVELALDEPGTTRRVLDLGTGSGAIAIAIAKNRPQWQVVAVDRSTDALNWAQRNAKRLGANVDFIAGSWFEPLQGQSFDIIVSNPPYIAEQDPHLSALRHEPRQALTSGPDGLDDLRRIISAAPDHLLSGGLLALEHGHDQGPAVRELLIEAGFSGVTTERDLAGLDRISLGRRA